MRSHGMFNLDSCHGDEEEPQFVDEYENDNFEFSDEEFISQMKGAIYGQQDKPKTGE